MMPSCRPSTDCARGAVRWLLLILIAVVAPAALAQVVEEDLVIFAGNDRADRVRELLQKGAKPDAQNARGETALAAAARAGNIATIDVLLAGGANVNARTRHGDLPIALAAYAGQAEVVRRLRAAGAVLDAPRSWTPLIYAATAGQDDIVRYLLAEGAEINAGSPNGTTALMMAIREGRFVTAELLLKERADPNRRNDNGMTALDFARRNDDKAMVESLKRAATDGAVEPRGFVRVAGDGARIAKHTQEPGIARRLNAPAASILPRGPARCRRRRGRAARWRCGCCWSSRCGCRA